MLGWSPAWDAHDALDDLGRGFVERADTDSRVLKHRSLRQVVARDISVGPLTTRHIP